MRPCHGERTPDLDGGIDDNKDSGGGGGGGGNRAAGGKRIKIATLTRSSSGSISHANNVKNSARYHKRSSRVCRVFVRSFVWCLVRGSDSHEVASL